MLLKTLTYTSLASLDLSEGDLDDILAVARHANAIEGVSGLLIFNGVRFLQIIEGSEAAIDGLVTRLRRDHRHSAFEVQDERSVKEQTFPQWSMELVQVSTTSSIARDQLRDKLPPNLNALVRELVMRTTQALGGSVSMPG